MKVPIAGMPRKRTVSIEEQKAQDEEKIRKELTKTIARANKAGANFDLERNLKHNIGKNNAILYPTVCQQGGTKRRKPSREQASSGQHDNDNAEFIELDFPLDEEEGKVGTWSSLLESKMLSDGNGFVLPILYRRRSNLLCTTVTFAIPVLKASKHSSKLDFSQWVFPGFCLQRSQASSENSVRTQEPCYFCSCCTKSVSCAGSIGLSQFVEPSNTEDACDCVCSKVLRRAIFQSNISLEKLADMSSLARDEMEMSSTVGGFHLGNVDHGSRDVMQYGTAEQPSFGIVVQGKCVTCTGHKTCSHVKQYCAQDMQTDQELDKQASHPGHVSQGSWGCGQAQDFEERLIQKLNHDRTGLKLRGLSTQTFNLEESAEKQAAIAARSHILPQGGRLQDPDKDGFTPTLVSSSSMLFLLNGVKLNMEVSIVTNACSIACVHPAYMHACMHTRIHAWHRDTHTQTKIYTNTYLHI